MPIACVLHVLAMCDSHVSKPIWDPFELVVHSAYGTYVSKPYDRQIQWYMADT
jgi:hypothetical protein